MSENKFQEKRQFERFSVETPVSFTTNRNDTISYSGTSQNLCARGLYITTHYAAKLGEQIKLILSTGDTYEHSFTIEGKVVRCKFDKKEADLFHVSIEFSDTHETELQIVTADNVSPIATTYSKSTS
ncbi:MAG: hypothetical protein GQ548_06085 [Methylophaga sp.]|nr:hypothetical protein [Methylophaga sp.]